VHAPSKTRHRLGKHPQERAAVAIVQKDVALLDTTIGDVPPRTWKLQAQRSGHEKDGDDTKA
jgi:hypothetical protein